MGLEEGLGSLWRSRWYRASTLALSDFRSSLAALSYCFSLWLYWRLFTMFPVFRTVDSPLCRASAPELPSPSLSERPTASRTVFLAA